MERDPKALDALLVLPPYASGVLDASYPAPYLLASHLRAQGWRVEAWDLNRDAAALLLDAKIVRAEQGSQARTRRALERHRQISNAAAVRYRRALAYEACMHLAVRNREMLLDTGNPRTLRAGPFLAQAVLAPLVVRYVAFGSPEKALPEPEELERVLRSPRARRLGRLLRRSLRARVTADRPRLVGLSVPFATQLVPALVLAREIRAACRDVHLCIGGPTVTLLSEVLVRRCLALGLVDTVVRHEGEEPLHELLTALRGKEPRPQVLEGRRRRCATGTRARPLLSTVGPARLEPLPAPLAGGELPVPVLQSRGCYWGRCTFCDYINLYGKGGYRPRVAQAVVADMEHYAALGLRRFRLIADSLPPQHAAAISREILRRGLEVTWHGYLRVDPHMDAATLTLLRDSGFRYATLGLESSSDRQLAILNKGYSGDDAQRFFERCRRAQIVFGQVNVIYDVPGTTFAEAFEVFEFCRAQRDVAPRLQLFPFQLTATSVMARDPLRYGIIVDPRRTAKTGTLLARSIGFRDPSGMTEDEKARLRALYHQHEVEIADAHAYGGHLQAILRARSIEELEGYRFRFVHPASLHLARARFTPRGVTAREEATERHAPRPLVYRVDSPEAFEASPQALRVLRAVAGRELAMGELVMLVRDVLAVADASASTLAFVKASGAARLLAWCVRRGDARRYGAAPDWVPPWRCALREMAA